MPVTLSCPACGLQQRVEESAPGALRCRECGEALLPDAQAADPRFTPQPPRPDPGGDEDHPRPQGSAGKVVAWVLAGVGGAVLLVVLGCVGLFTLLLSRATVTVNTGPGPVANPGPPVNVGGIPPPPQPPAWAVQADPSPLPPARVTRPDQTAKLGAVFPYIAVVPGSPGPFLASGSNDAPEHHREIWDLRTLEKVGELWGFRLTTHGALTPDGAYLGGRLNDPRGGYVVYSCKDGNRAFHLHENDMPFPDFYGFAGSRKFLVVTKGMRTACHVFEVPGGRKLRQFQTEEHTDPEPWAASPGGKYLALMSRGVVHFYDLDQGKPAGRIDTLMTSWRSARHAEMMFSADGKELALLFETDHGTEIHAWDLVRNRLACSCSFPASTLSRMKTRGEYQGRHLEWLDDGSGWLFRGEVLIDRQTGRPVWQMDPGHTPGNARHVVGSTHVARFKGAFAEEGLELVEIRRGEGALAQLPPGGLRPPAVPTPPSKEEAAAEAALARAGGRVRRDPKLPGNPVVEVSFTPNRATDADLARLPAFSQLRKVWLVQSKITDDGINELKKLPHLEDLNLANCKALTDQGFARVGELKGLKALSLGYTGITNDSVALLEGLTRLEKLSLSTTKVDDGALAHLTGMTELRELDLYNVGDLAAGRRVTDAGLEHLKGLTKLEVLLIPNSTVTGEGMAHLEGMAGLRHLNLFHTLVDDAGLEHLKALPRLEKLEMSGTRFTDDGLAALAGMKQLKELDLGFSKLTDRGMAHLAGLTGLRSLRVATTAVGDEGLAHLKGLTKLTHLDVTTGKVTDAGLAHLAGCQELFMLSLSGEGITDAGLAHLKGLKRLASLSLYKTKVTEAGVAELRKSLPRVRVHRN